MSTSTLKIYDEALEIAKEASEIAKSYFRKALLIETKSDTSPVTIADRRTEEFIRKRISEKFPDHSLIGEEFGTEEKASEYAWTIDPIDGTKSFVRGIPLYGTLLACLHKGVPIVGVVAMPSIDELYSAAQGNGAFCNGTRIHVSPTLKIEDSFVSIGDLDAFESLGKKDVVLEVQKKAAFCRGYADCYGHMLVARGSIDAMIDPVLKIWDAAPMACILAEAGGEYFNAQGKQSCEGPTLISTTPALRDSLLGLFDSNSS